MRLLTHVLDLWTVLKCFLFIGVFLLQLRLAERMNFAETRLVKGQWKPTFAVQFQVPMTF